MAQPPVGDIDLCIALLQYVKLSQTYSGNDPKSAGRVTEACKLLAVRDQMLEPRSGLCFQVANAVSQAAGKGPLTRPVEPAT